MERSRKGVLAATGLLESGLALEGRIGGLNHHNLRFTLSAAAYNIKTAKVVEDHVRDPCSPWNWIFRGLESEIDSSAIEMMSAC